MHHKVEISGTQIEYWKYERSVSIIQRKERTNRPRARYRKNHSRRADNVWRSIRAFRRLVRANLVGDEVPSFLTLTMHQIVSLKTSWKFLTSYFARCRREFGNDFRFIVVPEFQERNAVHFHCLVWGFPKNISCTGHWVGKGKFRRFIHTCTEEKACERSTRKLARLWLLGFVDCVETDGSTKLAHYLTKYLSSAMQDIRLGGERSYSASRNALRPMRFSSASFSDEDLKMLCVSQTPEFQTKGESKWLGQREYQRSTETNPEKLENIRKIHQFTKQKNNEKMIPYDF